MFLSMARLSLMAAAVLLPLYVQAVKFVVDSFEGIAVGQPFILTWWGDNSPVTIKLLQGDPKALDPVVTIASNVAGDSYTWTPTTIPAGTYVLSITQGTETNYSPQFPVANTFTPAAPPAPAGQQPPIKARNGVALPGATVPVAPLAAIAAGYPDAAYDDNGSSIICASDAAGSSTSTAFRCASTGELGHFQSSAGGFGKTDVGIGAVVVGMTFAVILLL
ncbi:hypothetical protein IMSHALPRED_000818 [Imshaugia aleurites]|uniref:Yeast cell wall synthesis Kre9/Knh1-like N-terminal domain-containing protein n=1 Tax=Imshaugia aleurites TaxID=172621 RepID=A0A8H3PDD3_9LECA|nr:hypothetical protein IMSHALPRED_000818 [Imshaugia aleurites]